MAAVTSVSLTAIYQPPRNNNSLVFNFDAFKLRSSFHSCNLRSSTFRIHCMSTDVPPTVADTKSKFLKAYKRPIPSIYNTVLQELIVQQHLTRYKKSYQYDSVFALGFVSVYDQLMEGYPSC